MIPCICINDKHRPREIAESKWIKKGEQYRISHIYWHPNQGIQGCDIYKVLFQYKDTGALTNGRSVNRRRNDYPASMKMRNIVEDIIELAYWKKPYTEKSDYIQRVEAVTEMEYYFRRNEIFARFFEQYISTKLQKRNVYNRFLSETKYTPNLYLKPSEMKKVSPLFDKLIDYVREI